MGTDAWVNWRAFSDGAAERENFDDEAHSDRQFTGGPATFGPFTLSPVFREAHSVGPGLMIHGGVHAGLMPELVVGGKFAPTDSSAYHGGTMSDEIAALVSLELGVRVRVAGTQRLSGFHDGTNQSPMLFEVARLARPGRSGHDVIPRAMERTANIGELTRLGAFPLIDKLSQIELVRAARSYARALWWANEDPNQAWLQLVTAVEVAGKRYQLGDVEPVDLLRDHWPSLWAVVSGAGIDVEARVAKLVMGQTRARRAFVDFVVDRAPDPPALRPAFDALEWSRMRSHAAVIYGHRSEALHGGKPFPSPMLDEPLVYGDGVPAEIPGGITSGAPGGSWAAKELPMLLCTFEYIARGALLHWWDELIAGGR